MTLLHALRPRLPVTLAAAQVGVWEYDIGERKSYLDGSAARLLNVPAGLSRRGIPVGRVSAKVHAADHIVGDDGRLVIEAPGRVFTHILRYAPTTGVHRCAIAHGSVDVGPDGAAALVSGVLIDVTERSRIDFVPDEEDGGEEMHQLTRAIDAALCAHGAIKQLGSAARPSLLHVTELLLHELGMELAKMLR